MLMMKATAIVLLMCIKGVCSDPWTPTPEAEGSTTVPTLAPPTDSVTDGNILNAPCTTNPVEEGSTAVITQTVPKTSVMSGKIQWRLTNVNGSEETVTDCNIDDKPPCTNQLLGENVYSGTMVASGSNFLVTLTIQKVIRISDQTTWTWASRDGTDNVFGQCDLDVYSFQSAPVCHNIGISSYWNRVSWACVVSNVYPKMECRFEKGNGRESWITRNVHAAIATTYGKYPPRTIYHNYTCFTNLPVKKLGGEGTHQFTFTAAVVKKSSTIKTTSPIVKDLNVSYPRVELVGCPNADDSTQGYISEKDITKTCQCRLKEVGNPSGVAQWLDAQGTLVGQDGSLSLVYNPDDPAPTYTCRGYSGLGSGPTITYKPRFAYTPTLTEYKANSNSSELKVSDGDTVTFVCNAVGDPRPSVSVRGQRWDGIVTLQYTLSGPYVIESSGTKNMSCKDTDMYTCIADNGVGGRMSTYLYVSVECAPELSFTSSIQDFSILNGTDLKIEIPIIGFPEPQSYSLEKVSDNYRRKRAVIAKDIGEHKYFVIYIPDSPPKGVVVLMILGMTDEDDGQYKLTIDNGIKDGLDYSFSVSILSEIKNPSDDDNNIVIGLVIGLVVAVVFIASLCLVLVIIKVRTNRWVKERQSVQRQVQQQQH